MPAPEETTAVTREFLADHPDTEDALAALVERDAADEPWTFAETELDSGRFGELVSRGLAYSVEDGYRLENPAAIRTALETASEDQATAPLSATTANQQDSRRSDTSDSLSSNIPRLSMPTEIDVVTTTALLGTLLAVAAARLVAAPVVFRNGHVVSPANDTYFFRYWQERLAARANGVFDLGLFADMGGAASTRPLAHATNWWVTVLVGGVDAAPLVAAWLPVTAAVVLGYVVYRLTRLLAGDVRVALAAVLFYGLAPVNVVYTSVGFLDHQAHQYLWLGLLALGLTALAVDMATRVQRHAGNDTEDHLTAARAHATDPKMWAIAAGLAVAVAASAHVYGGSPLTFIPVAAVVGFRVALDVRHDVSPALGNAPLVAGLTGGAALAVAAHQFLGWHETIAAATPVLVAGGALAVVGVGEGWRRTELPVTGLIGIEAVVAVGGLLAYRIVRPETVARFRTRAADLFFREGATETVSLFSSDFSVIFGPLLQLGLGFYFAIAVLAVTTWALVRRYEPAWLVVVCFAWYYTLLATIQVRFAGQLAIFIAPFAGIGLLYLLAAIDITRPATLVGSASAGRDPADDSSVRRLVNGGDGDTAVRNRGDAVDVEASFRVLTPRLPDSAAGRGYLAVTVALVLVFNLILVPPLVGQTTHDPAQFDAAQTIDAHADRVDRGYPENFVLSRWGDNRMYNYFVNGESQGYGYARSNHEQLLTAQDPDEWYDRFQGRVGYVVITEQEHSSTTDTTYTALYEGNGVGANGSNSVSHYRLLAAEGGVRTFVVVPGATIRVINAANETVTATTMVNINGKEHPYMRNATVADGTATVQVAYPGTYQVGTSTVTVTDTAVLTGNQTTVSAA